MPAIARFFGIVIKMFFRQSEHNPPHIHALYGEYSDLVDIETLEMFEGDLPPRALSLVKEWMSLYKNELVSVHKVGYFVDRPCIFSPKGCENAVFKEVCP